jgi:xanthine dehydrogenase YagR molybdenum-binding subunit
MEKRKKFVGEAVNRIDGLLKVTGTAKYATDYTEIKQPAYAVIFKSTIAAGRVTGIETAEAEKSPGVLAVITHRNAPKLNPAGGIRGGGLLQNQNVEYHGENIGVVIAETFEQARLATRLIKVSYEPTAAPRVDFEKLETEAVKPKDKERDDVRRGDVETAMSAAEHKIEAVYETPIEHHQPMEPHATIAVWEADDKIVFYNSAQVVNGAQNAAAATLGLKPENVRIVTPHIGGGFGSKGGMWANLILAALAAKAVKRPVKLALTRQQMFNSVGLRQRNRQKLRLAATKDGKLTALAHETVTHGAIGNEFVEPCGDCSKIMYETPNSHISYRITPMNVIVPTFTRGPGKSTGSFALESAIDELAHELKMDPVEFRLKNEPAKDPSNGKPWSSRKVTDCLKAGAEKFGWNKRHPEPRQTKVGNYWVGYGVACGTYPARQRDTSAIVKLTRDGNDVRATVELAASDLGTGTHTILAQTAAEALGLPINNIGIRIGDSSLPAAAGSVGSVGAASFANAVNDACEKAVTELQAKSNRQWFAEPTVMQLMEAASLTEFQTRVDAKPPANANDYSVHSFNANFCEAHVEASTGMVKIPRFLAVTGAGRILNPKTSDSQIIGGVIWGIGMALHEESVLDPRWGNFVTRSFADYHIPANLDIGRIETIFINEEDKIVNKMGVKGIGEVGIVGVAAAVANAIFNATGKRVRELPITPDKLI